MAKVVYGCFREYAGSQDPQLASTIEKKALPGRGVVGGLPRRLHGAGSKEEEAEGGEARSELPGLARLLEGHRKHAMAALEMQRMGARRRAPDHHRHTD